MGLLRSDYACTTTANALVAQCNHRRKMVYRLSNTEGSLVDDESLIEVLQVTKKVLDFAGRKFFSTYHEKWFELDAASVAYEASREKERGQFF